MKLLRVVDVSLSSLYYRRHRDFHDLPIREIVQHRHATPVDELFAVYDSVLTDIADRLSPLHSIRRRSGHLAPWFDDRCRQARRQCRRLERRYRRTGTDDDRRR